MPEVAVSYGQRDHPGDVKHSEYVSSRVFMSPEYTVEAVQG